MSNKHIVLLTDAENTRNPSVIIPIARTARSAGSLDAVVLFGNQNSPTLACWNTPQIKQALNSLGAVWSPLPKLRPGKNAADIALTYEAAVMTHDGKINEVWIVSSDSDFTPLVERLGQKDVRVVVFGSKTTPQSLRKACSSFVLLDDVQNGTRTASANSSTYRQSLTFHPDKHGWFHGFVFSLQGTYGFIQVGPKQKIFFCGSDIDAPLMIQDLRTGDPVVFKLGNNHKGLIAIHVRRLFALRTSQSNSFHN
jgi:uncharacterized LabA/DUF88 family protein